MAYHKTDSDDRALLSVTRRILITGGHGFIGKHLSSALLVRGYSVVCFGRGNSVPAGEDLVEKIFADLTNESLLSRALSSCEAVFHKAAKCPSGVIANDDELRRANIESTQALVNALRRSNGSVKHVLFDSSISVYGEGCYDCHNCGRVRPELRTKNSVKVDCSFEPRCPHCGSNLTPAATSETEALHGASAYARSKKAQEELMNRASEEMGFTLTVLRYATVYGAGQSEKSTYGRLLRAILRGDTVTLTEDGLQKRDFVHVDDVIDANIRALERKSVAQITVNVGSGSETTLSGFVDCAISQLQEWGGKRSPVIVSLSLAEGDVRHCKISCDLALKELGFRASTSLRQGLAKSLFAESPSRLFLNGS